MDKLEIYCKKLKLGSEILEEFEEIELPLTLTEESVKKCEFLEKNDYL